MTPCWTGSPTARVDVIATDHAPHHYDEKHVEFDRAPFGIVGLETAVPLVADDGWCTPAESAFRGLSS